MTEDTKKSQLNIEEQEIASETEAEGEVSLEQEIANEAGSINEKTAVWETIAQAEDSEDSSGTDAAESDSDVDSDTRETKKASTETMSLGLNEDPKRTFEMPLQPDWSDEEKHLGLSGDGEQSMPKPGPNPEDAEIIEKIRERKIANSNRQKRYKRRLRTGIVVGVIVVTALILSFTNIFVVDLIEVRGNSHFTGEEIINIGHASAGRNIFYNSGVKEVVENLEENPYIKSASVKRKLPSTLVIQVEEREEAFALKYDDDYLVVDDEGILLRKTTTTPKLTQVEGLVVSKIKLGEKLGTKDNSLFNSTLSLIKAMQKADMYFINIDMSDKSEVKAYIYETFVVKADYETLKENLANGRLHAVVEKLFEDSIQRGTITFNDDDTASFEPGL